MLLRHFMLDVGPQESNSWLLGDESTHEAVLIDAGAFDPAIVQTAADLDLRVGHILITHLHWDHVDGLPGYLNAWPGVRIIAPAPLPAAPDAQIVAEGDRVSIGPFSFDVLKTSGHTPESISYHWPDGGICFVGDAIFAGAVGGTSTDQLHEEEITHLKKKILTLPESTLLLSGHGPVTTVAIEKAANPFLQPGFGRTG